MGSILAAAYNQLRVNSLKKMSKLDHLGRGEKKLCEAICHFSLNIFKVPCFSTVIKFVPTYFLWHKQKHLRGGKIIKKKLWGEESRSHAGQQFKSRNQDHQPASMSGPWWWSSGELSWFLLPQNLFSREPAVLNLVWCQCTQKRKGIQETIITLTMLI